MTRKNIFKSQERHKLKFARASRVQIESRKIERYVAVNDLFLVMLVSSIHI